MLQLLFRCRTIQYHTSNLVNHKNAAAGTDNFCTIERASGCNICNDLSLSALKLN